MMQYKKISIEDVDALIFDFDGVLTNNLVYTDQKGGELVSCSRADGLAFDALCKMQKPVYILSTEKNSVVSARANKLKVPAIQGVGDKADMITKLADQESLALQNILYVGNDLNDYHAMQLCGYSACPADAHPVIKSIASVELKTKGGYGVVRELLEDVINIDLMQILYSN